MKCARPRLLRIYLRKIRKVLRFSPSDISLTIKIFYALIFMRLYMNHHSFKKVLDRVKKQSKDINPRVSEKSASHICQLISRCADALPSSFSCLPRALVAYVLCRRYGHHVVIKIGTRRLLPGAPVEAHAWIEEGGTLIMGGLAGLGKFSIFESFGGNFL